MLVQPGIDLVDAQEGSVCQRLQNRSRRLRDGPRPRVPVENHSCGDDAFVASLPAVVAVVLSVEIAESEASSSLGIRPSWLLEGRKGADVLPTRWTAEILSV